MYAKKIYLKSNTKNNLLELKKNIPERPLLAKYIIAALPTTILISHERVTIIKTSPKKIIIFSPFVIPIAKDVPISLFLLIIDNMIIFKINITMAQKSKITGIKITMLKDVAIGVPSVSA